MGCVSCLEAECLWISIEPMVGWFGQIGGNPKIVQIWRFLPLWDMLKMVKKSRFHSGTIELRIDNIQRINKDNQRYLKADGEILFHMCVGPHVTDNFGVVLECHRSLCCRWQYHRVTKMSAMSWYHLLQPGLGVQTFFFGCGPRQLNLAKLCLPTRIQLL